jgi:Rrf2 family protein
MRFTTKTEYGIICLIYMARHAAAHTTPVTVRELAAVEQFSASYTEKILQTLRSANIVNAVHGKEGGYVLARPAAQIKLLEVIEALEGHTFDVFCAPDVRSEIICNHFSACGVKPVWQKTKELLDRFYDSVTLEMVTRNEIESASSLKRP